MKISEVWQNVRWFSLSPGCALFKQRGRFRSGTKRFALRFPGILPGFNRKSPSMNGSTVTALIGQAKCLRGLGGMYL